MLIAVEGRSYCYNNNYTNLMYNVWTALASYYTLSLRCKNGMSTARQAHIQCVSNNDMQHCFVLGKSTQGTTHQCANHCTNTSRYTYTVSHVNHGTLLYTHASCVYTSWRSHTDGHDAAQHSCRHHLYRVGLGQQAAAAPLLVLCLCWSASVVILMVFMIWFVYVYTVTDYRCK